MIHHVKKILLILPWLTVLFTPFWVSALDDPFVLGNQAFIRGDYTEAVQQYRLAAEARGFSAPLLYNLGCGYAALGQTGKAVLALSQARRIAPGNGIIKNRLDSLRKDKGLYRNDRPWWQQLFSLLSADQWLLWCGVSALLAGGCLLAAGLLKDDTVPRYLTRLAGICLLTALCTLVPALYLYQGYHDAVVLRESKLRISPFAEAASIGAVSEGRVVRPLREHGEYVQVRQHSGHKGWLKKEALGFIDVLPEVSSDN